MKLPRQLKIGGHKIKITLCDLPDGINGEFSTVLNEIKIDSKLPDSQRAVTLLHEILHALNSEFDKDIEHILLESLSQQIYQVLTDNKLTF